MPKINLQPGPREVGADPNKAGHLKARQALIAADTAYADIHATFVSCTRSLGDVSYYFNTAKESGDDWVKKAAEKPELQAKLSKAVYDFRIASRRFRAIRFYNPWSPSATETLEALYVRSECLIDTLGIGKHRCDCVHRLPTIDEVTHVLGERIWRGRPSEAEWNTRATQTAPCDEPSTEAPSSSRGPEEVPNDVLVLQDLNEQLLVSSSDEDDPPLKRKREEKGEKKKEEPSKKDSSKEGKSASKSQHGRDRERKQSSSSSSSKSKGASRSHERGERKK